ncbi:MAG: hypothetical protein R2822_16795 [Spirosomataceae bacterium]
MSASITRPRSVKKGSLAGAGALAFTAAVRATLLLSSKTLLGGFS